jgi:hypothetical protein
MKHVARTVFALLTLLPAGCGDAAEPVDWPGFDDKVIQAGKRAFADQAEAREAAIAARSATRAEPVGPIPATREAVLNTIRETIDKRGFMTKEALEAIKNLGPAAIDPLVEILADDSLPAKYTRTVFIYLVPPSPDWDGMPWHLDKAVLLASREKVFDALAEYLQRRPVPPVNLRSLNRIVPHSRIPRLIEHIESSSGELQRTYIETFCALTNTDFPMIQRSICGYGSPEAAKRALKEGTRRQEASVADIKAWWAAHKEEFADEWLAAALQRDIAERTAQIAPLQRQLDGGSYEQFQFDFQIRQYYDPPNRTWYESAFGMLVEEFDRAADGVKPYVLRLIGSTQHPEAAAFVARQLESEDPNLQYAAIAASEDLHATGHAGQIGRILRATDDDALARQAVEALEALAGANAIEDITYALGEPRSLGSQWAARALGPYLVTHAEQLRRLAETHAKPEAAQMLNAMLDAAAAEAAAATQAEADESNAGVAADNNAINSTREMLRSDDPERQKLGLRIVEGLPVAGGGSRDSDSMPLVYPELLQDVLPLIRSRDYMVRLKDQELITKGGVPGLTVDNASKLMGAFSELDRHVAAFCYAKYGPAALELVKKAAYCTASSEDSRHAPTSPAIGLVRVLLQEKVPGVSDEIISMVKESRTHSTYVILLQLLDDKASADLLGELLDHSQYHYRNEALRVIAARRPKQLADKLVAFAADQTNGADVCGAALALIAMQDPRAWQAVRNCLASRYLESENEHAIHLGHTAAAFGAALGRAKATYRNDIHAMLGEELSGENRQRVLVTLTTALSLEPEPNDGDVLRTVANSPNAAIDARILASVALSKLGDRAAIPVLHQLVRTVLTPDSENPHARRYPDNLFFVPGNSSKRLWEGGSDTILHTPSVMTGFSRVFVYEQHHVNLGLALRRLGDETLVGELVAALDDGKGGFDTGAFAILAGNLGLKAVELARQWMEEHNFTHQGVQAKLLIDLLELEVPLAELLPRIMADPFVLQRSVEWLIAIDSSESAEALVQSFPEPAQHNVGRTQARILDALCRMGDARGLTLALDNPLLFASVVKYLPEADPVDFPDRHFEYNRIEEAMRVADWYRRHAKALTWDAESGTFRLAAGAQ